MVITCEWVQVKRATLITAKSESRQLRKIRDQVPNAYGEAAKIFAAAALKAAGLEDANAAGSGLNSANAVGPLEC